MKRKLLAFLCSMPWLSACRAGPDPYPAGDPAEDALRQRFRGLSVVLVVDAAEGAEMEGVKIHSDNGGQIFSHGGVSGPRHSISAIGSARVPRWVRVSWRKNPRAIWGKHGGIDWEGPIIGDHTLSVAERIPDAVLESLRKNPKGDLRIKFRLHPNGVYFGWDIERRPGLKPGLSVSPVYELAGGDFQEARIFNGVTVRKGWYIDKNGHKIETDD